MKKKIYRKPELEITVFEAEDVITTSTPDDTGEDKTPFVPYNS